MPVEDPMVPTDGSEDDHVPPVVADERVVVCPIQAPEIPVIAAGCGFTVSAVVAIQPVGNVYVANTAPALMPETVPSVATVPTSGLFTDQVPPAVAELSVTLVPAQNATLPPEIAAGSGCTVTSVVRVQPPVVV
jgi:hypothetical protein